MPRDGWIYPWASREEVAADLADTERKIAEGARPDRMVVLLHWRARLSAQLAEMDAEVAA